MQYNPSFIAQPTLRMLIQRPPWLLHMHHASYSPSFVAPVEGVCSWTMVFIKPFIVALFAVVLLGLASSLLLNIVVGLGLVLVVGLLLVP